MGGRPALLLACRRLSLPVDGLGGHFQGAFRHAHATSSGAADAGSAAALNRRRFPTHPPLPTATCPLPPAGFRVFNGSANSGGCVSITDASPTLSGCVFESCVAGPGLPGAGGALLATGLAAAPRILNCSFLGNSASQGGGAYIQYGSVTLEGCVFDRNSGAIGIGKGGALFFDRTKPSVVRDTSMTRGEPAKLPRVAWLAVLWRLAVSLHSLHAWQAACMSPLAVLSVPQPWQPCAGSVGPAGGATATTHGCWPASAPSHLT